MEIVAFAAMTVDFIGIILGKLYALLRPTTFLFYGSKRQLLAGSRQPKTKPSNDRFTYIAAF
ncbi:hypothetical protein GPLA_4102 [Paraglaciecola polaris LMG 21857]|uniref:Uncharacterized protein n=1 Tax=Paraglaciecola polaris LMG 21857 TaxID=1129793 RepID=K6ZG04_9ALTE|nr:hypothetical protein GPLA_4102 [Paraglaciecola polaris LMG 21857]|tara:strand:- start:338 stop:523 length:186 start_codon:yes stop_codon:yes gene_type:complete